jgi:O-antigen/teichoic acid export membrane protein
MGSLLLRKEVIISSKLVEIFSFAGRLKTKGAFTQNVASTFLVQAISLFLSLVTAAIVARWLGPEGKGTLSLALLVPGIIGVFLGGGIEVANTYFAGTRGLDVPTLTANSLGLAILATVGGIAVVLGLIATGWLEMWLPGIPLAYVLLAITGFPLALLGGYFSSILLGLQRILAVNIVNLTQGILRLVLTAVTVIGLGWGIRGALLASIGTGVIALFLLSLLLQREGAAFVPRWKPVVMRTTLSFGLRGYLGNVLQFFNYRLDMFLVNYFLGPAGVGIYSVSVALAELLWYLPNAVGFVIFPKAAATRPEVMNTFTPRVFRATLGLTVLGALGLALMGMPFIQIVYSSAFGAAYVPMLALLPGVVLLGGGKVLTNEIAGRGYPHYNSINAGLALILTIALDLILIPRYGVLGASLASSVAYTLIFLTAIAFYLIVSRRASKTSSPQSLN